MEPRHPSTALRVLTDALQQGVLIVDADECLVHANPAAARRFRIGTQLRVGRPVAPWLMATLDVPAGDLDRMRAGETIAARPPTEGGRHGELSLTRVLLPTGQAAPWVAIVVDDRRGSVRSCGHEGDGPAFADSHAGVWSALVRIVERSYDEAVPVALFTAEVEPPAEVGALCRALSAHAAGGDMFGFVDPCWDLTVLRPSSLWAVMASPGCEGAAAMERRRALTQLLRGSGWRAHVGVAVVHPELGQGTWHAQTRAASLLRQSVASQYLVKRDQRAAEPSVPLGSEDLSTAC